MCGRFTLTAPENIFLDLGFDGISEELQPRYNIAPSQSAPVIRVRPEDLKWQVDLLQWGLIPHWSKDPKIGHKLINARAETVAKKPSFREAFRKRRCLIPATGFFEWKKEKNRKQPYYFTLQNGRIFAMAGLWESWINQEREIVRTFTVLTTESNNLVSRIHDRMPLIIMPENYSSWLLTPAGKESSLEAFMQPFPSEKMTFRKVSDLVNNPKNDTVECIE